MSVLHKENHILPKPFHRDCAFFHGTTIESILPPCAPENSVELCFYCIEGNDCPDHPHRRKVRSGIDCFADDDFNLVDEHHIKNVHKTFDDEKNDTKEFIFVKGGNDKRIKQEPCNDFEQKSIAITMPAKTKTVTNKRSTTKSVNDWVFYTIQT
ncbi:hypothetical protein Y032_0096g2878 [Ancylostoma ceylanicum]|uniref:Uncharacterized protein n=1 Tax=Ancylostoma ceylanicum TaxID=53326 RepID=A0A016TK68_9BILA|nr:hypothetical protein Y032_0096g2878 [Ancylostoma ceylanicum]